MSGRRSVDLAPGGWTRHRALVPALIFSIVAAAYIISPVRQLADSRYALVLAHGLISNGHPYLDQYFPAESTDSRGRTRALELPYQVENVNGRIVYGYPWATSILSVPLVWLAAQGGLSVTDGRDRYQLDTEALVQGIGAALVTAATITVLFSIGRAFLTDRWSLLVAAGAGFGTSLWTTASRVLWSHTWEILLVSLAIHLLVRKKRLSQPVLGLGLGSLMAGAFLVRPTGAIPLVAIAAFLLFQRPRSLPTYVLAVAGWLGLAGAISIMTVGTPLSPYHGAGQNLQLDNPGAYLGRLAGLLVSPGRGLLVYSPVIGVGVALTAFHWRRLPSKPLATLAFATIVLQIGLMAGWEMWWGGHSYGPRLLVDLVPWFALLAMLGLHAHLRPTSMRDTPTWRRRWLLGIAAFSLLISIAMHARGAADWGTLDWNGRPNNVDENTARLWDWSQPPFLATASQRRRS